jgi:hypothetical protein
LLLKAALIQVSDYRLLGTSGFLIANVLFDRSFLNFSTMILATEYRLGLILGIPEMEFCSSIKAVSRHSP